MLSRCYFSSMPGVKITPQVRRIVAMLHAHGITANGIARICGIDVKSAIRICGEPDIKELIDEYKKNHETVVVDALIVGEMRAAHTLIDLLESKHDRVRLEAANSLLDRAASRGRPVERIKQQTLSLSGDIGDALARALADPGVQKKLKELGYGEATQKLPSQESQRGVQLLPQGDELRDRDEEREADAEAVYVFEDEGDTHPRILSETSAAPSGVTRRELNPLSEDWLDG